MDEQQLQKMETLKADKRVWEDILMDESERTAIRSGIQ